MRLSLDKLVGFWSKSTPDSVAVVTPTRRITYKQLYEYCNQINTSSLESTIKYGVIVRDSIQFVLLILSMMRDGKIFVVIGANIDESNICSFLHANSITHVITDTKLNIKNCKIIKCSDLEKACDSSNRRTQHLSDTVGGFLSSGSTGIPKVFYRDQYSLISEALMWIMELQLSRNTSFFLSPPFAYIGSFVLLFSVLYSGGRIIVNGDCAETGILFDYSEEIDYALFSPKIIRDMLASDNKISIKNVLTMGAPISAEEKKDLAKILNCNVYEMWGNSEGLATITNLFEDPSCSSLGRATFTDEIFIVDRKSQILPNNCVGWIAGITDNVANDCSEEGMIVSGDIGYLDDRCKLHLIGRDGDVMVFPDGGYFSCSQLCRELRERIEVVDLAVILKNKNVYCFLQSDTLYDHIVKEIFQNFYGKYSNLISLKGIFYRDIPYNMNGKIDYEELKNDSRIID